MEKEELLSSIKEELGSTKLSISSQTLDAYAEGVAKREGENVELSKEYVQSHVDFLKSLDGNYHHDFARGVEEYKKKFPIPATASSEPAPAPTKEEEIPAWAKKLQEKLERYESEREAERVQEAKDAVLKQVKKDFVAKQKQAGLEVRDYFLGNALKEIAVPETGADVSALSSELEKKYNQHLKSAGFQIDKPKHGGQGGGNGDPDVKALFEAKKARRERERGN